jgi:hemolysin III
LAWLVRSAASLEATVAAWVYGLTGVACYLTSSLYHMAARTERARSVLRRADHSMIYLLIAGSFTPPCVLAMAGWWRWTLLAAVWLGSLAGITMCVAANTRLRRLSVTLYLILGWAGVAVLPALSGHRLQMALVVVAGLLYTVGAILFFRQRPVLRPDWYGYHEFWHTIGVVAGALLFVVNLNLIATPPQ